MPFSGSDENTPRTNLDFTVQLRVFRKLDIYKTVAAAKELYTG